MNKNIEKFPQFEIFQSINGYNKSNTIDSYKSSKLKYYYLDFDTYGTLANFISKYNILLHQINKNIPYMCFIEDDLLLNDDFISFIEKSISLFDTNNINMIRLENWGEGYITSLNGAKNIVSHIQKTGIIANIDNQLRMYCGNELRIYNTPWQLLVETNKGDCLKTDKIDKSILMPHIYNQPQFGENWFDYSSVYDMFVEHIDNEGHIVEIGSWKGKSSAYLAVEIINSQKNIKLDCIDTWAGSNEEVHKKDTYVINNTLYQLFMNNIQPIKHIIKDIRMTSQDASLLYSDDSIDIVFIDGCHEYDCVKQDVVLWMPKVKIGGILAGHDYTQYWPGVINAVNETIGKDKIQYLDSCWIYHKTGNNIP